MTQDEIRSALDKTVTDVDSLEVDTVLNCGGLDVVEIFHASTRS